MTSAKLISLKLDRGNDHPKLKPQGLHGPSPTASPKHGKRRKQHPTGMKKKINRQPGIPEKKSESNAGNPCNRARAPHRFNSRVHSHQRVMQIRSDHTTSSASVTCSATATSHPRSDTDRRDRSQSLPLHVPSTNRIPAAPSRLRHPINRRAPHPMTIHK